MSEDEVQNPQHSVHQARPPQPTPSSTSHINTIMGDQHEETATTVGSPNLGSEKAALGTLDTIDRPHSRGGQQQGSAEERLLAEALQRSLRVEKSGTSGLTTESTGIADVVTPPTHELSPGLLNSLRGSSSPSYSQVSVGSIGPTTLPGLPPPRTCDLTPVTRNTSGEYAGAAPVTPSEFLHGEHLALPADLNEETLGMPPLKMTVSKPLIASGLPPEGNGEPLLPSAAVQFPARRFYSFTTREQYEVDLLKESGTYDLSDDEDDEEDDVNKVMVQPYAPLMRRDNFDIESLPDEELQQIFCTGSDESSTTQHRLAAVPLEGRIPSLHLANRLQGSTTSFTSYHTDGDEEEDSLVHIHGDADDCESLSSSTSNKLSSHDGDGDDDPIRRKLRKRKQLLKEERAVEWLQSLDSSQVAEAASSKFLTQQSPQVALPRKEALDLKRITSTPAGHP